MTTTPDPLLAACAGAIARSYGLVSGVPNADEMDAAAAVLRIVRPVIIEACARVCDARIGGLMDEDSGKDEIEWRDHEAAQCRDAIRTLAATGNAMTIAKTKGT